MSIVFNVVLNFFLVSLFEETYVVLFFYFIAKNFKIIKDAQYNKRRFLAPIIIPAILTNIARYIYKIDVDIVFLIFLVTMFLCLLMSFKIISVKKILISIILFLIPIIINISFEGVTASVITYYFRNTIHEVNLNILQNFISVLPMRYIELVLLSVLYKKLNRRKMNINDTLAQYSHVIFRSIIAFFSAFIGFPLCVVSIMLCKKYFIDKRILLDVGMNSNEILLITSFIFLIHLLALSCLFIIIDNERNKIKLLNNQKNSIENIKSLARITGNADLLNGVNLYTKSN